LTLGGGYGAAIKNGQQDERGEDAQGSVEGRNPGKTKRRIAPIAIQLKRSPVSGLGKQLKDAREQQAAAADGKM
jgi:hypothetical protein